MNAKTKVTDDPVIRQCDNCLELNASSEGRCHNCGEIIEREKDES